MFFFKYTLSSIKCVKLSECHLLEVQPLSKLVTEDTVWYGLYCCVSNDRGNSKTDQKKNNIVYMKSFPREKKTQQKHMASFVILLSTELFLRKISYQKNKISLTIDYRLSSADQFFL